MALTLISIYEATDDIGAALDEALLISDDKLRGGLQLIANDLKELLRKEEASRVREPPAELVNEQLDLIERLEHVAQKAGKVETQNAEKLSAWQDRIAKIKASEETLASLEETLFMLTSLSHALHLRSTITSAAPVEARVEALLELCALLDNGQLSGTRLARWIKNIVDTNVEQLREALETELAQAVKAAKWPLPQTEYNSMTASTISHCLGMLGRIQVALRGRERSSLDAKELTDELWGIQALARPFVIRFQYHFCMERATNRVDRPEWFVAFIVQTVRDMTPLIELKLQPALHNVGLTGEHDKVYVDLLSQFIRVLIKVAFTRLDSTWTAIEGDEALVCHTMDELLAGDRILMGEFGYGSSNVHWPTLSSFFYQTEERIEAWLRADSKFARNRMEDIVSAPNSWKALNEALHIDNGGFRDGDFATEGSDAVMAMIDALGSRTDLCKSGTQESKEGIVKLEFAQRVQGMLIREFVEKAAGRSDLGERLNSLQAVVDTLLDWKLKPRYAGLNQTAKQQSRLLLFRGGDLVKRVSGARTDEDFEGAENVWVFDPVLDHIRSVLNYHIEAEASKAVHHFRSALREYERKAWPMANSTEVSAELRPAIASLKAILPVWGQKVNPLNRMALVSHTCRGMEGILLDVYSRIRQIPSTAAKQIQMDIEGVVAAFEFIIPNPRKRLLARLDVVSRVMMASVEDIDRLLSHEDDETSSILRMEAPMAAQNLDLHSLAKARRNAI